MAVQTQRDFSKNPEWGRARANVWLKRRGRPQSSEHAPLEDVIQRGRLEIPCTGSGGIYSPCAKCGEFGFPCPDPEAPRLYRDDEVEDDDMDFNEGLKQITFE